ncbi:MAG: thioredoxin domain-containing protein, partial [Prevotella sp.]|nr:thioredoxin domain-containing protein [Prevotella sp.]MDY4218725.1 thioredoxin domain-containing protein [Prevotella sp.]
STACTCLLASSSSFSLEVARYVCDKTLNNLHRPSAAISLISNDRFGFNRLRFNKNVFYTLLDEYPLIEKVPLDMSINIGQPTAPTTILKVCDPFCRSCSKSHIEMEKLYDNKNIFLQVIFYVSSKDNETKKNIIKLFFALKEKYGNQYMLQVLHDWYSQTEKNFEEFRKKYNDIDDKAINAQKNKITWLVQKNIELKIQYTPTFYINNHHMPDDFYSYNDFSSLFTDKN